MKITPASPVYQRLLSKQISAFLVFILLLPLAFGDEIDLLEIFDHQFYFSDPYSHWLVKCLILSIPLFLIRPMMRMHKEEGDPATVLSGIIRLTSNFALVWYVCIVALSLFSVLFHGSSKQLVQMPSFAVSEGHSAEGNTLESPYSTTSFLCFERQLFGNRLT
jgi:hypothetical protein